MEEVVLLMFGLELEFGFEVLFGFEEFMSELLLGDVDELELLEGELLLELDVEFMSELLLLGVEDVLLELEGEVEFMSELLEPVVEDGEVELLEPVWLDWVDGVL